MPTDYTRFRFRAVVDWIEVEIVTANTTNAQTVRRKGALSYVEALNEGPGGAATRFRFRLYDPEKWADIRAALARIEGAMPFLKFPVVTGIEVSFDAYSNGATCKELAALVADFYKFHTAPASINRRFAGRTKGDVEGMRGHVRTRCKVAEGRVIVVGNRGAPISQRAYFKTTDNNGCPLAVELHRARFENTLTGNQLPVVSLEAWQSYDFTQLAELFKFRRLRHDLDPFRKVVAEYWGQIGEKRKRKRKEGGTRLYSISTVADVTMNRKAYDALRELTRRMR